MDGALEEVEMLGAHDNHTEKRVVVVGDGQVWEGDGLMHMLSPSCY